LIPISRSRSYKNIDSIELLKELKKFEIDFQKYLLLQIEACGKTTDSTAFRYSDNVKKLINKIDQKIEANSHFYILNFNYTQILTFLKPLYALENNVHGTLNSEIIMGIDDANVKGELFYFSKTYKKLLSHLPMYTIPDEIKQIAFFGHSLSDADYSYFHSLFDYYNLYGSKVVLKFCYSPGYLNITSIYKLIHKYGETFSNKQQGKNLLHKLLLENRIQIIEIA
jgi:hypothetical protein